MAAVSAPQTAGSLVLPSSLRAEQNPWKQAVPHSHEQTNGHHLPKSHPDLRIPSQLNQQEQDKFTHQNHRASLIRNASPPKPSQRHTDTVDSRQNSVTGNITDTGYLAPSRVDALGRKQGNISQAGSEADSLLDLYRQQSVSRSGGNSMDRGEGQGLDGDDRHADFDDDDPDRSKWIHRDKLAKIESQELQQAGYQLPPQFRTASRSHDSQERSMNQHDRAINGAHSEQQPRGRLEKRQRVASSRPDHEGEDTEELPGSDLRTPEEIAADPYEEGHSPQMYRQTGLRASSSRIPLSKSSPMPIPQDYIERNTPLPRKRGYSGGWSGGDEDGLMYSKTRSRGHSIGSQVLLDDTEHLNGTPTPASRPVSRSMAQSAPGKAKIPGKATPMLGARKTSAANRNISGPHGSRLAASSIRNSPGQRPGTRSGESRPTSAINRPEGDPPWLATMYKPDPRLPPEQQLLPTHAKRLQQEQWEKEGKYGSTFDKEFAPLAIHTHNGLQPALPLPDDPQVKQKEEESTSWPLNTPLSPILSNSRPGTPGTEHGRYSTIPRLQSTPPPGSVTSPKKVQQPTRMHDVMEDEGKKKGGCGCCIVM